MYQSLHVQTSSSHIKNNRRNKLRPTQFNNEVDFRPRTVDFQKRFFETSTPKPTFFRTLDNAEYQLNSEFKEQMSPFIKEKIRNSLSRNSKRRMIISRTFSNYADDSELDLSTSINQKKLNLTIDQLNQTTPISNKSFKISSILNRKKKSPFKQQQIITSPLLTNTKQRIQRLIEMKRQKDLLFQGLKSSIQRKCSKAKEKDFKKLSLIFNQTNHRPPIIYDMEWDRQWKQRTKNQQHRYRNRLLSKHTRENSMKIQI